MTSVSKILPSSFEASLRTLRIRLPPREGSVDGEDAVPAIVSRRTAETLVGTISTTGPFATTRSDLGVRALKKSFSDFSAFPNV